MLVKKGQERTRKDKKGQERTRKDKKGQERTRKDKKGQENYYNIKPVVIMKKKLISVNHLIDRINRDKKLTKEEKFEKVINTAYKRIYGVKEENWDNAVNKVIKLTEIAEKENWRVKELGIKETVNRLYQ